MLLIGLFNMRTALVLLILTVVYSCGEQSDQNKDGGTVYDLAKITTPEGEIIFLLHNETPRHKASFLKLVKEHYFESYTFNRVIDNFVAQGGCPDTPEGFSDSPYLLEPEFNSELRHVYGAVGAGRDDNPEMLSAGCQFYIVQNKDGLARLDDKYTVFGQVVRGMDVVDRIVKVATDSLDKPLVPLTLDIEIIRLDSLEISKL
jgi:cyclophilin family peptidyl-prolyl cis-trans isomerase